MYYKNGIEVKLGDDVSFSNGDTGRVVFSIDTEEYSQEYPKRDWAYLMQGVMIKTDQGALVHLKNNEDHSITLVGRQSKNK